MRKAFFLLLLVNIALLIWLLPEQIRQKTVSEPESQPGVMRLALLTEQQQERPAEDQQAEEVSVSETAQDYAVAETPQPSKERTSRVVAVPEKRVTVDAPPEQKLTKAQAMQCRRIGPIPKRADADKLSVKLRALGLAPELNTESVSDLAGYWVLVPPQETRAQAVDLVAQLKEAGVTDLWRFTGGALAHAISLGLFKDEARAEVRRKAIEEKGFEAEVRARYRQTTHYWLDISYSGDSPLTDEKWSDLTAGNTELIRIKVDCL
jgi:cell division protein FtsN